jgi:hypothetical protein
MRRAWAIAAPTLGLILFIAGGWGITSRLRNAGGNRAVTLELPTRLEALTKKENILATYENTFHCTLYYTPSEFGVTKEGGFDTTPETKPGLGAHLFPADFLRAVRVEGFGRIKAPIDGKSYIRYWSNEWGFIEQPVDNRQRPLIARKSCAIAHPFDLVKPEVTIRIRCPNLPVHFNNLLWQVNDTGSGLGERQLDLYWGEDTPLGPGKKLFQPRGFDYELVNPTIVVIAVAN